MATYEHNALMQYIDETGNMHINYPATKAKNVMMGDSDVQIEIIARAKTSDVLYTLEEISACTDFTNKISGAKAVEETLKSLMTGNFLLKYVEKTKIAKNESAIGIEIPESGLWLIVMYNHSTGVLWLNGIVDSNDGSYCIIPMDGTMVKIVSGTKGQIINFMNLTGSDITLYHSSYVFCMKVGSYI